jgi:hypothetical protein
LFFLHLYCSSEVLTYFCFLLERMNSVDIFSDKSEEDSTKKSKRTCDIQGRNMDKNAIAPICVEHFMLLAGISLLLSIVCCFRQWRLQFGDI